MATTSAAARTGGRATSKRLVVPIQGMTCAACERRVAKALDGVAGVTSASASAVRGRATVTVVGTPDLAAIDRAVRQAGYAVGVAPLVNKDPRVWRTFLVAAVVVATVGTVVYRAGITELSGRIGGPGADGLLLVFALGLAAGVSTCMAMVGGIVLAISATAAARAERAHPGRSDAQARRGALRSNLAFQAGRVVGFGMLGVILGAVGARIPMPTTLVIALTGAVAATMLLLGLRLTELSPRLAGWSPHLPVSLGARLGLSEASPATTAAGTALAGAATFFLPCGFTQAVQLYALSTGSPREAGAVMATFALGTVPGLLTLAGAPTVVTGARRATALRVLGVVVIGFSLLNATAVLRLVGVDLPGGPAATASAATMSVSPGVTVTATDQTLESVQDSSGYHPGQAVIYAGLPTHWVMTSEDAFSCASSMQSRELGFEGSLAAGRNVIELPALRPGTYDYSCTMGMYFGKIVVIPGPATPTGG